MHMHMHTCWFKPGCSCSFPSAWQATTRLRCYTVIIAASQCHSSSQRHLMHMYNTIMIMLRNNPPIDSLGHMRLRASATLSNTTRRSARAKALWVGSLALRWWKWLSVSVITLLLQRSINKTHFVWSIRSDVLVSVLKMTFYMTSNSLNYHKTFLATLNEAYR